MRRVDVFRLFFAPGLAARLFLQKREQPLRVGETVALTEGFDTPDLKEAKALHEKPSWVFASSGKKPVLEIKEKMKKHT